MVDLSRLAFWKRGKGGAKASTAAKPPDTPAPSSSTQGDGPPAAQSEAPAADSLLLQRKGKPEEIAGIAKRHASVLKASKGLCTSAIKALSGEIPDGDKAPAAFDAWFDSLELKGKEQHKDALLFVIFYCTYIAVLILSDKLDWPAKAVQYGKLSEALGDKNRVRLRLMLASVMQCTLYLSTADHPGKVFTKENAPKARESTADKEAIIFVAVFEEVRRKGPAAHKAVWDSRRSPDSLADAFENVFPAIEYIMQEDGSFERLQAMAYPPYCAMLIAAGLPDDTAAKAFATVAASIDPDAGKHMRSSAPGMLAVVLLLHSRKQLRKVSFAKSKPAAASDAKAKDGGTKPAKKDGSSATGSTVIKPPIAPQEDDLVSIDEADEHPDADASGSGTSDTALRGVKVDGVVEEANAPDPARSADTVVSPPGVLPGCDIPFDPDETYLSDDEGNSVDEKGRIALRKGQRPDGTFEEGYGIEPGSESA
ncbi:MAG: hypothetical protein KDD66_06135 [Bdellovibrionales bacterium]|nr:hypothetical protein [Bdellovibrionales bacterium]